MREDLVYLINEYLTNEILDHVTDNNLEFNWTYERGQFVLHFTLVNTPFTIVANSYSKKNNGMQIEPDEISIKIVCYNYIDNFELVANILGEFEKELLFFEETFPAAVRRQYIHDNFQLLKPSNPRNSKTSPNFNILSNKYLQDNNLWDEYGAKEIALDHLLGHEFHYNIKKNKKACDTHKSK